MLLKGIKKSTSKLQYRLYDWGKSDIEFIVGRNTARLIAIRDLDSYSDLYLDLKSTALMGIIFELLDQLTDDNHQDTQVFECIEQYVELVKLNSNQYKTLIAWLLTRLLYILGYGINLSHCVVTGSTKAKDFGISIRAGGLVISDLKTEYEDYTAVSSDLIYILRQWQKGIWLGASKFPWDIVKHQLNWYKLKSNSLNLIK